MAFMNVINRSSKVKRNIVAIALLFIIGSLVIYLQLRRLGYFPPLADWLDILCFNSCPLESALHTPLPEQQLLNYNQAIAEIIGSSTTLEKSKISILIEKSKYRLTVYYEEKPIKSYPVVFGKNPAGDKLKEGDNKTPEGILSIRDFYPHDAWSKFLWIDYPTQESWRKHLQAKQEGKINWSDRIGSEIGIHGVPAGQDSRIDERYNWTWGCIALKNQDIDELYEIVQIGTKVEIIP